MKAAFGFAWRAAALLPLLLAACNQGGDAGGGGAGADSVAGSIAIAYSNAPADHCPNGGVRVESGVDHNRNGALDRSEVAGTQYGCRPAGAGAGTTLVAVSDAGEGCTSGGVKLQVGVDASRDGVLDESEVSSTNYICNGSNGANGIDGTNGFDSLTAIVDEPPGASCANGGLNVSVGLDGNRNGALDPNEVQSSRLLCNGLNGANGANGLSSLMASVPEAPGVNCTAGGIRISSGLDANANGALDPGEVSAVSYVCNGNDATAACSADAFEPDNKVVQARVVAFGAAESHNHCDNPVDWYAFTARTGYVYTIETSALGVRADTVVCVSSADAPGVPIACNDDVDYAGGNLASKLTFQADTHSGGGNYYFTVESVGALVGAGTEYALSVSEAMPANTPDLLATGLTVSPASAYLGQTVTVSGTVTNSGSGPSGPFRVGIYFQVVDPSTLVYSEPIAGLAAGESANFSQNVVIPAILPPGTYTLVALADDLHSVAEFDEGNNAAHSNAVTLTQPPLPDLNGASLESAPASAAAGSSITVSDTIANSGGPSAGFEVALYLSADAVIGTDDIQLGQRHVDALGTGASSTGSWNVVLPSVAPGTYYLGTIADPDDAVRESDEANNASAPVAIVITQPAPPDLIAILSSAPDTAQSGGTIEIEDTVTNVGAGWSAAFDVRLVLATPDADPGNGTPIATRSVAGLAAGASDTVRASVGLPAVPAGTYVLYAIADGGNTVDETDETNNVSTGVPINITAPPPLPDLVIAFAALPSAATVGGEVTMGAYVTNMGAGPAPEAQLAYFVCLDQGATNCLSMVAPVPLPALAPGTTASMSFVLSVPPSVPRGNYTSFIRVDPNNTIAESSETNNSSAVAPLAVTTSPLPDLAVVFPSLTTDTVGPGGSLEVSFTVANLGYSYSTADWGIGIYASTDPIVNTSDVFLCGVLGGGGAYHLGPGEFLPGGKWTCSAPTTPGTYYLSVIIDPLGAEGEPNEFNNITAPLQFTVTPF